MNVFILARRRSAVGKHSAAAGSGVSTTESTASGLKLSAMSSSGHDDTTPDAPSAGASAAAATASAGALVDDAVVNPDASVETGAVSAAGRVLNLPVTLPASNLPVIYRKITGKLPVNYR